MRRNSGNWQSSLSHQSIRSPTSAKTSFSEQGGSLSVRKGASSFGRRMPSTFKGSSNSESAEIVREQYLSVRNRCQRELGSSVGHNVLDTSISDLHEWIRNERLTTLPHKGGSWDRVLISAHHFADQVCSLGEAIESFAPESGVASNLVSGQCLLLLEKVSTLLSPQVMCPADQGDSWATRMPPRLIPPFLSSTRWALRSPLCSETRLAVC